MDIVTEKKRSQMMSGIKASNTKPEIYIRKILFRNGFRYRVNKKTCNIKPDLVMKKWNLCIFINGCFWHRHKNCKLTSTPKSNVEFWKKKFDQNTFRDEKNYKKLKKNGWYIGIIWECSIRNSKIIDEVLIKNIKSLSSWEI